MKIKETVEIKKPVEKAVVKPAPKVPVVDVRTCECGRETFEGGHQCWPCAHRA